MSEPVTNDPTPAWCGIQIGCLSTGTDWDTAYSYIIERLVGFTLRFKKHGEDVRRDITIVDGQRILDRAPEADCDRQCGIVFVPTDEDGHAAGPEEYVAYEDIEELHIY